MPTSREDQIIEGILCLSLDRRWHPISYYFRLHAAKNTIRKYLKQLVASGFLTVLSVSAPEQYRPRQQFQITDEGCHEAIQISYDNAHLHMKPRTAERFIQMLTHQLEFYKACIAELQKRSGMELIHQDFAVHITRVDERLDAFRAQNADLPEKFHLVQKYFRDADIQLETCEKQVEQLTQQNNLLKDRLHRLHDELQNLKDEVHRSIRK